MRRSGKYKLQSLVTFNTVFFLISSRPFYKAEIDLKHHLPLQLLILIHIQKIYASTE